MMWCVARVQGTLTIDHHLNVACTLENVVWRGCRVMNTKWVYGLVVFTGQETKLILNSSITPAKRSNVERSVDTAIILIFITLAVICSISTVLHANWLESRAWQGSWYFVFSESQWDTALTWITFLILYNNLVPISLYVTLEIVKAVQAQTFISGDDQMYYAPSDSPAAAHTSNLNEDLGQIQFVFADKTGTLTRNDMVFKKCSIGGVLYGGEDDEAPAPGERARRSIDEAMLTGNLACWLVDLLYFENKSSLAICVSHLLLCAPLLIRCDIMHVIPAHVRNSRLWHSVYQTTWCRSLFPSVDTSQKRLRRSSVAATVSALVVPA